MSDWYSGDPAALAKAWKKLIEGPDVFLSENLVIISSHYKGDGLETFWFSSDDRGYRLASVGHLGGIKVSCYNVPMVSKKCETFRMDNLPRSMYPNFPAPVQRTALTTGGLSGCSFFFQRPYKAPLGHILCAHVQPRNGTETASPDLQDLGEKSGHFTGEPSYGTGPTVFGYNNYGFYGRAVIFGTFEEFDGWHLYAQLQDHSSKPIKIEVMKIFPSQQPTENNEFKSNDDYDDDDDDQYAKKKTSQKTTSVKL